MVKKYKKAYGLKLLKGFWYYRNRRKNDKEQLITLQTTDELIALNRAGDIEIFKKFLREGSITRKEVLSKCKWYIPTDNQVQSQSKSLTYYFDKWLEIRKVDVRQSTYERNIDTVKAVLREIDGNIPIEQFDLSVIEEFKKARNRTVTLCTMNIDLTTIKVFFSWLEDNRYIARGYTPKIKIRKPPTSPSHYISETDFKKLIELESIPQVYRDICKVYYTSGCRKSEIIEGRLNCTNLIVASEDAKTGRQYRIPLDNWQIQIVRKFHQVRDEFLSKGYKMENFKTKVTKIIQQAYKKLGIYKKGLTNVHSLRHSFGGRMYLITGDIRKVQDLMRHELESTTNQYLNYAVDDLMRDFPADAKYSIFKDNLDRIQKANSDVLEMLGI